MTKPWQVQGARNGLVAARGCCRALSITPLVWYSPRPHGVMMGPLTGTTALLLGASPALAATLTVDPSGGADHVTIGAAVAVASDGDTIEVAAGTYTEAIDFDGKDIEIVGTSGAASTVLDAGGASSYAVIANSGESVLATLEGFTIRNSGQQGAYVGSSGLSLVNVIFEDLGSSSDSGGAIQSWYGRLALDGCSFDGNTAAYGGHIYAHAGTLKVQDSQLSGGTASYGGGLYLTGGTVAELEIVTLDSNEAVYHGGAVYLASGSLSADNVTVEDNRQIASSSYGAGIYAAGSTSLTLDGVDFIDNYNEDFLDLVSYGGALFADGYSDVVISDSSFTGNQAYYGGAIYTGAYADLEVSDTVFDDNYAYQAGALYTYYTDQVELTDNVFSDNTSYSYFGAAWFYAVPLLTLTGNTWQENTSTYGYGGAFGQYYSNTVSLTDETYTDNYAYYYGGAIYGYYWYGASEVVNSRFEGNEARYGYGGGLYVYYTPRGITYEDSTFEGNTAYYTGGGLYHYYGSASLSGLSFDDNEATHRQGGGAYLHGVSPYYGYVLSVVDVAVSGNEAGGEGGGLAIFGAADLDIRDVIITENRSESAGGGMYVNGVGSSNVERVHVAGNEAVYGGGLYVRGGTGEEGEVEWTNLTIQQNTADVGGGACFLENEVMVLRNNSFVGNSAIEAGSSLCLYDERIDLRNNAFTYDDTVSSAHVYDLETLVYGVFEYNDWYANAAGVYGGEGSQEDIWGTGTVELDPVYASYDGDGDVTDDSLVLARDSRLVDAGDPEIADPDGSVSDIGAFGGPDAPTADADGDGYQAWIDCDDSDAAVSPDGTEIWYDGVNQDCRGSSDYDQDGDGEDHADHGGVDCDDTDASVVEDCGSDEGGDEGGEEGGSTGDSGEGTGSDGDTGGDGGGDAGDDGGSGSGGGTGGGTSGGDPEGCGGCAVGGGPVGLAWLLGLGALLRRRRAA